MLPSSPVPERIALNRVTFGERDVDIQLVEQSGWTAWVENQLNPPVGDDTDLAKYLSTQTIPIQYPAYSEMGVSWPAVDENRPLQYINMSGAALWAKMNTPLMLNNGYEFTRTIIELWAAGYIRNAHSRHQLREVMTGFWLSHFNVAAAKSSQCQIGLFVYDRDIVRPNAFGNFRQMLEGIASSMSMPFYLDNADSIAAHPNENYARELMELQTMGRGGYFGKPPGGADVSAQGFTDDLGDAMKRVTVAEYSRKYW